MKLLDQLISLFSFAPPLILPGQRSRHMPKVRAILIANGYKPEAEPIDPTLYCEADSQAITEFQDGHVDDEGNRLIPDGKIGNRTWWALAHPSGKSQTLSIKPPHIENLPKDRAFVVDLCRQLRRDNIRENPDGSNTGGGVERFHKWFGMAPAPWCAMAATWIVYQAFGFIPWREKTALVAKLRNAAREAGMFHGLDYAPRPGDLFIIIHANGTGHTGIVMALHRDGRTFWAAEGNTGNRFAFREHFIGEKDLVGFVNPYGDENTPPPPRALTFSADGATKADR